VRRPSAGLKLTEERTLSKAAEVPQPPDYFRGDQTAGITAPDLSKDCTFAEHIVHARGKRTRFTSVSLDRTKIKDFGEVTYLYLRSDGAADGHSLVEHAALMAELRRVVQQEVKDERLRGIQALRYADRRKEGLVAWLFDITAVQRKDLITWAYDRVQRYFRRV
jgi:hypothetical protein